MLLSVLLERLAQAVVAKQILRLHFYNQCVVLPNLTFSSSVLNHLNHTFVLAAVHSVNNFLSLTIKAFLLVVSHERDAVSSLLGLSESLFPSPPVLFITLCNLDIDL